MRNDYKYFTFDNIPSLNDVLDNRERRIIKIHDLEKVYPDMIIICFKLNIPGEQKINDAIINIFNLGVIDINLTLDSKNIIYNDSKKDITGPEYFCVAKGDPCDLKMKMVNIEENSYFGRLYDIDLIYKGKSVSRQELDLGPRKCFLCNDDAKICARSRKHNLDSMIRWIEDLIDNYEGTYGK
ncbi:MULTISPECIES: citrate lyase holo-[acyl-carrier protein] synthase [Anaerococcus]|nr:MULTISPECIES: citrate lyase holo-[acyl-carrier protein] synthase [Anaerococcus]MDU2566064.1 citrate lyase holo-[acyl-carrier protein] synthase [Anaerococcus sp.]